MEIHILRLHRNYPQGYARIVLNIKRTTSISTWITYFVYFFLNQKNLGE